jgi:Tfp pilus assembly protein PilV
MRIPKSEVGRQKPEVTPAPRAALPDGSRDRSPSRRTALRTPRSARGFSLIEVTLAIGIAAFCLVCILGLLPIGLTSNQNSVEQTAAAGWASAVAADLRATPAKATISPLFGFTIPAAGGTATSTNPVAIFLAEDGTTTTNSANERYRVNVWFTPPGTGQRSATIARILITWPALADSNKSTAPKNFSGSFEAVITLDRN